LFTPTRHLSANDRECGHLCNTDGRVGRVVKVISSGKRELSMAKTAASKLFTRSENVLA
jgi:ferritin-like metal-binding protein YciE